MQNKPEIILASQSKQRKIILSSLGLDYSIQPAHIDEQAVKVTNQSLISPEQHNQFSSKDVISNRAATGEKQKGKKEQSEKQLSLKKKDPESYAGLRAVAIAYAKAKAVAEKICQSSKDTQKRPNVVIIAADTYAYLNGEILEKPIHLQQAQEMLSQQAGQDAIAMTGFAYLDLHNSFEIQKLAQTKFRFRELTKAEIRFYVNHNPVLTWSAAFCPAYPAGMALIESVQGSLTGFTHGMPVEYVCQALSKSGLM